MLKNITDEERKVKAEAQREFLQWISYARDLVDTHFPNDPSAARNSLIVETAKSMMMMHKMGEIKKSTDRICQAFENIDGI
jgi:hypothetical protein